MKNLILILLMVFVHSASAQNDSILPNVFAAFDVRDTYMNPDLNIWTSKYRFVKTDVYSGHTEDEHPWPRGAYRAEDTP